MNNSEIFPVRCRIYSWDNDKPDSSILMGDMLNFPSEPLFPEEKHEIDSILKKEKEIKHSNQIRENYIKNKYHKN